MVLLDVDATKEGRTISSEVVRRVGEEANMPFSVGGGITSIEDIQKLIACGAEKVILNSFAIKNIDFLKEASETFGSSTIVLCIDIKKTFFRKKHYVFIKNGKEVTRYKPVELAKIAEDKGAGEIIIQSIQKDGTMEGYDILILLKAFLTCGNSYCCSWGCGVWKIVDLPIKVVGQTVLLPEVFLFIKV